MSRSLTFVNWLTSLVSSPIVCRGDNKFTVFSLYDSKSVYVLSISIMSRTQDGFWPIGGDKRHANEFKAEGLLDGERLPYPFSHYDVEKVSGNYNG